MDTLTTTSTLATDLTFALAAAFDTTTGGTGPLTDVKLQCRSGEPVAAHALVLQARCAHLSELITAAAAKEQQQRVTTLRIDCERDELLRVLGFLYLEEIQSAADANELLRLRALAQEWALPALDEHVSAALGRRLSPSLCCDLVRETSREEARARLAGGEHAAAAPTCAKLRLACAEFAAKAGFSALARTDAFGRLPSAQQAWLFGHCHAGHALHALASGVEDGVSIDAEAMLHALLAPPHACELDGRAAADQTVQAGGEAVRVSAGATPLQHAVSRHNWAFATLLLDAGASPHPAGEPKQRTLLHVAAEAGDAQACAFLAQRGASVSAADADGCSPLDVAVDAEQPGAATAIREAGGTSTFADADGGLIHRMAAQGRPTPLALLATADLVDAPSPAGLSPLHLATLNGRREAVDVLIGARADLHRHAPSSASANGGGGGGGSPLHLASRRGDAALVELLLERGSKVDVKAEGLTPLHLCAPHPACARLLLSAGASVDERDANGSTPLIHAAMYAPPRLAEESVSVLLEAGARPNLPEYLNKQVALHKLCARGGGDGGEVLGALYALVSRGALINAQDKSGLTPLHLAAFRGREHLALALVAHGASLNQPSSEGVCPLSARPPTEDALRDARPPSKAFRAAMLARVAQPLPWLPDASSESCQLCESAFTGANRRHHCRHCGRIVCSSCSPHKMAIPKFGVAKTVRICTECAPVLEVHGARPLGAPGSDTSRDYQAESETSAHLDSIVSARARPGPESWARPPAAAPHSPSKAPANAGNPFGDAATAAAPPAAAPRPPPMNPFGAAAGDPWAAGAPVAAPNPTALNPFGDTPPATPAATMDRTSGNPFDATVASMSSSVPDPFADSD